MKKVLLTTSALSMLAGAAAADISWGGYGRLGVFYNGSTTVVRSRVRVNMSASTETDGGLTFGAWFRLQNTRVSSAATGVTTISGANVSVSNGAATLTFGNTGGAVSSAANIWGCGGSWTGANQCNDMADNSFGNHTTTSSSGAGPNTVRLNFALGSANVAISGGWTAAGAAQNVEVAANFAVGGASVGIGYEAAAASPTTFANLSFDAGSATVGLKTAFGGGSTGYIVSVNYGMGDGTLYAYAGNNLAGNNAYGVRYSTSLGGGVTASVSLGSIGGTTQAAAGAQFNF